MDEELKYLCSLIDIDPTELLGCFLLQRAALFEGLPYQILLDSQVRLWHYPKNAAKLFFLGCEQL